MPTFNAKTHIGAALVILSSLFYASYGVWTKLMGDFFGGYTASAYRSILVLLILIPLALYRRELNDFKFQTTWRKLLAMVVISVFIWGLFYYSVLDAGIGLSLIVNYTAITIGMLFFGWLLVGEKFTRTKQASIAIGVLGLLLVYIPTLSEPASTLALLAALISGFAIAANTVVAKQLPYNTTQAAIALWGTSVAANVPMMLIISEPRPSFTPAPEWFYLICFAVASVLASWLFLRGMKFIEAGMAGIIGLLEIVFGVIFGIVFFQERPALLTLLGSAVILLAAALPYLISRRLKR